MSEIIQTLIIAEKPELGRAIAAAIDGRKIEDKAAHVIRCPDAGMAVTWARGHLMSLKEPKDYDEKYGTWRVEDLPIFFPDWGKKVSTEKGAGEYISCIKNLLRNTNTVWHAGDPDDEGQAIVDEVLAYCGWNGPVYRLDTGNTTVDGLKKAFTKVDDNANHRGANDASYARTVADMMVGVNLTRFFSLKNPAVGVITIGRVQTPTLGLVVRRDLEVENHVKQKYFVISPCVTVGNASDIRFKVNFLKKDDPRLDDGRVTSHDTARDISDTIRPLRGYVTVEKKESREAPPLPFNLPELQTYCGSKFGYSPEQVLNITQTLRDNFKCISYNRTDCRYLTIDHYKEAPEVAAAAKENIEKALGKKVVYETRIRSRAFSDEKTKGEAHTAIIPTNQRFDLNTLNEEQKNVYLSICLYYLAQFFPPAIKEITSATIPVDDTMTISSSSTVYTKNGYRSLLLTKTEREDKSEQSSLSSLPEGQTYYEVNTVDISEAETKPPARYTQTSLNADMCRISKFCTNPRTRELLMQKDKDKTGENGSIGTTATRAGIITDLINRGFLEEDSKHHLISTGKARELCRVLPKKYVEPDLTAEWWVMQEDIRQGNTPPEAMLSSVLNSISEDLSGVYDELNAEAMGIDTGYIGKCPWCGGNVYTNKVGYGCDNWESGCKFTIWKDAKGGMFQKIHITPKMARELLAGKTLKSDRLYSPKKDCTFKGSFHLDTDKNIPYSPKLVPEFNPR